MFPQRGGLFGGYYGSADVQIWQSTGALWSTHRAYPPGEDEEQYAIVDMDSTGTASGPGGGRASRNARASLGHWPTVLVNQPK